MTQDCEIKIKCLELAVVSDPTSPLKKARELYQWVTETQAVGKIIPERVTDVSIIMEVGQSKPINITQPVVSTIPA